MLKSEFINEFIDQASKLLPGQDTREEVQKSLQVMAQSTLSRLELVTRDEFDSQVSVLQKTRAKVDELEVQLKALEDALKNK